MLLIGSRGQIPAQPHCCGSGDDFSQSRRDNDVGGRNGGGKPSGQREGHGQTVRHANHDIADGLGTKEVLLGVRDSRHRISNLDCSQCITARLTIRNKTSPPAMKR